MRHGHWGANPVRLACAGLRPSLDSVLTGFEPASHPTEDMHGTHELLKAIAVVLCVAAVTTVLFRKLRQPVVLGYILAGLIVGPHVPIPLVADRPTVEVLSELGVILLMFALGLEFSVRKLIQVGPTAGLTAVIESSIMIWLGFLAGRAFGWSSRESLFAGAVIAISSTTIVAKAFDERQIRGRLRDLVVGVLIVEDLIAILLMAVLTAVSSGEGMSAGTLLGSSARLAAFLVALIAIGLLVVPRTVRMVVRLGRPETTIVATIGFCFATALLAQAFGYSVALGAFIAGSLVGESGDEAEVANLVLPIRDLFAAVFFVSVGMLIDPAIIVANWLPVLVFTVLVIGGKVLGVTVGAFLAGNGTRTALQAGMSLAQIGEFSFIIAGLGLSLGATRDFLYPIAVAVSAITTLTTPLLIRFAGPVASYVDRKLPRPIQTFAALYGTWLEDLKARPRRKPEATRITRLLRLLLLDAVLLVALVIATTFWVDGLAAFASGRLGVSEEVARTVTIALAAVVAGPLVVGIFRLAGGLALALADVALPARGDGKPDLAEAPRRALVVTVQLALVLLVGLPVLALTQPFVPTWAAIGVLGGLLVLLGVHFWRSAINLQGHVKAGAQVIVEALVAQAGTPGPQTSGLERVNELLPGLGDPVPVRLEAGSPAVGKSLAQLGVRGVTGASVLAIVRGDGGVIVPSAGEVLRAGDTLALAGTHEAVAAAVELLTGFPSAAGGAPVGERSLAR
jgi:CPA2 family monovalent cation:H+ antiporter-2